MKERNTNLDFIRVLSTLFVVGIHVIPHPWGSNIPGIAFSSVLATCNGFFFMLSGQLNLTQRFSDTGDYRKYYIKKAISILFPYILVTCILSAWDMFTGVYAVDLKLYLKTTYKSLMTGNASTHLWFMYSLLGMLLGAPFLGKLLQTLKDQELKILFGAAVFWGIISVYLTQNIGIGFSYSNWMLPNWTIYFFAGYFCSRMINGKNKKILYSFGITGFIVTVLGLRYLGEFHDANDYALAFVLFTMAAYVFFAQELKFSGRAVKYALGFLSRHAFTEYMLHYYVFYKIVVRFVPVNNTVSYIEAVALTLGISYLLAIILDTIVIFPVQKLFKRILLK